MTRLTVLLTVLLTALLTLLLTAIRPPIPAPSAAPAAAASLPLSLDQGPGASTTRPGSTVAMAAASSRTAAPAAPVDLVVTTANIRSGEHPMPQTAVTHDLGAVARRGGALLLQEIIPARYRDAVRRQFQGRTIVGIRTTSVPIVVPRGWEVRGSGHRLVHRGRPGAGPDRFVTWAVVVPPGDGARRPLALLNTHFVHAAWNGRSNVHDPWRKERWREHQALVSRIVADLVARGIPVLGGGDLNRTVRRGLRPFHPDQRWVYSDGGIDKLFWVPAAETDLRVRARHLTPLNSDHDARTARVRIDLAPDV